MDRQADRPGARRRSRFFREIGPVLAENVAQHVRLNTPDEKGETRRQRNERFGVVTTEPEPVNPDFEYLLEWFWDIRRGVPAGINGPDPLSMTEIANWSSLTGTVVRREEIGILREVDAAFLASVANEHAEAAERTRTAKPNDATRNG